MRKCFEINENEDIAHHYLWYTSKAVPKGKFINVKTFYFKRGLK